MADAVSSGFTLAGITGKAEFTAGSHRDSCAVLRNLRSRGDAGELPEPGTDGGACVIVCTVFCVVWIIYGTKDAQPHLDE